MLISVDNLIKFVFLTTYVVYIYAIERIKNPTLYICLQIEKCVCIYFPCTNIPGVESFLKKEAVKTAGFEPTIFQL